MSPDEFLIWCEELDQKESTATPIYARNTEDALNQWCNIFCNLHVAPPSLFEDKVIHIKTADIAEPVKYTISVSYIAEFHLTKVK